MMKKLLAYVQSGEWYDGANDDASMALVAKCGIEAIDYNIDHVINPWEGVKAKAFLISVDILKIG